MRRWLRKPLGATLAAVVIGLGGGGIIVATGGGGGGGAPPATNLANLWITDGAGACTRQAVAVTFAASSSPDARCGTGSIAYAAANAGDYVGLKETITDLTIRNQTSKGSAGSRVTYRPDGSDAIQLADLDVDGNNNIEVRDVQFLGNPIFGWSIKNASNVTYRNIDHTGVGDSGGGINGNTNNVAIIGGDMGPIDPVDGIHMNNQFGQNTNTLISGVSIHDLTINNDASSHDDCIQVAAADGLIIEKSRFTNCGIEGVFLSSGGSPVTNITIRNNFFGTAPLGTNTLRIPIADAPSNVLIQNNTFVGHIALDSGLTNIDFIGNIIGGNNADCSTEATNADDFDYNVTTSACAGATNNTVVPGIVSELTNITESPYTGFDLHITGGASAKGKGSPTSFPSDDFDGTSRPQGGSPPDAGADEVP